MTLSIGVQTQFCAAKGTSDWGYDDAHETKATPASGLGRQGSFPKSRPSSSSGATQSSNNGEHPVELKATPLGSLTDIGTVKNSIKPKSPGKTPTVKGAPSVKHPSPAHPQAKGISPESGAEAVQDWLELFALAAPQPLTEEQQARFKASLVRKMSSSRSAEVTDILDFWNGVQARISNSQQEKEAFASLFKALLRFASHMKTATAEDREIESEVLGPERIAVPGDPALTEDAIDAYSDMACFLYEQAHPGKTVDAVDNRTVMAAVISDRFKDAPTEADKRAVANFGVTWTKFKVQWAGANAVDREKLLSRIASPNNVAPGSRVKDPLVDSIFTHGPWK